MAEVITNPPIWWYTLDPFEFASGEAIAAADNAIDYSGLIPVAPGIGALSIQPLNGEANIDPSPNETILYAPTGQIVRVTNDHAPRIDNYAAQPDARETNAAFFDAVARSAGAQNQQMLLWVAGAVGVGLLLWNTR